MNLRQLTLLSPYRLPTESTLYMGDEEVAAILNGYSALWHPAAILLGQGTPRLAQPYDHEDPQGDHLFAMPDNPPLMLPEDWTERARAAGALVFTSTPSREDTLANLLDALRQAHPEDERLARLLALPEERVRPFMGIGLGCAILEALFEAMSHDNVLAGEDFWQEVRNAACATVDSEDPDEYRRLLQSAADRLLSAREVLYPVTLHLLDVGLFDVATAPNAWPAALASGQPFNLIASGEQIERLAAENPDRLAELREKSACDLVEVLGGVWRREDPLTPIESQLWNLLRGIAVWQEHLGTEPRTFARKRSAFHAQLPLFLQSVGISRALLVTFDEALIPSHQTVVISWPSHDGKQVDSFTRAPQPADSPQTFFHLAHYLHQTIMQDQAATFLLLHRDKPPAPWYLDWLELTRFAPVLGRHTTFSGYFNEVMAGDYTAAPSPDEFHLDYLTERTAVSNLTGDGPAPYHAKEPIGGFARQTRLRRMVDAGWTFATMLHSLGGKVPDQDGHAFFETLKDLESRFEREENCAEAVQHALDQSAEALAARLVARGNPGSPGWLLLNPCAFKRRIALEIPDAGWHPIEEPIKACQVDGSLTRLVVEVPALGFAWFPKRGPEAKPSSAPRMRMADERGVRNDSFEAEIDPQTGGLRGLRDQRYRIGRVGQQLVYNPGSTMKADRVEVTSSGPALGEVISEGVLLDENQQPIARFKQRYRAWMGRPMLDLRIELTPLQPPEGYAWHAYYAARFAWREESIPLLRGCSGLRLPTSQTRPESPDFIELRVGKPNTVIFPGGLPFHQRHGGRMLDAMLVCEGEPTSVFELGISLDREQPMQTALGVVSPAPLIATTQGPPHVGATGWLYHLDANNILLTSLRPATDHPNALVATLLECSGAGGQASFRCVRNPVRAVAQDLRGNATLDLMIQEDSVELDMSPNDLMQLRVEFS